MKNKNIKEIVFYMSLIFIMVISLNLAVMDSTGMDISFSRIVMFTLIAEAVASIIIICPITILGALITGICWTIYQYYMDPALIKLYIQDIPEFSNWLYGYIVGYNYFEPGYSLPFAILYIAMTVLIISHIVYSGRGSFALILLGTVALSFFWFIYVKKARLYLVLFLFAAIMLYSYQIYKKRLKEWKTADISVEYNIGYNWMSCTAIVAAISLMLSLAIPLNINSVKWTWLNDKVINLFPFTAEWRNDSLESSTYGYNSRFSLNSVGYKGNKLGGEVRLDESVLMTVKTKGEDTLYLRGIVKDRYFDNNWSKSRKSYKEYNKGFRMPLPYGKNVKTYEKTLDITYEKLLTSTVFAPYSIYQVQHNSRKIYADENLELYTSKMTMKGESYTVNSMMPYIDVNKLQQAETENLGGNEFKLYTSIAPDIPERVRSLAEKITKGQNNNYDKAKAVEKYLRENYKYTLKPPVLPSKAEFTDHFLFEGKEGYCTYFATSMAVLLRASGVPCRYVEGFIAIYEGEEERKVRGTDAHAWVEAYFDNYGWVAFEPTPEYPAVEFVKPGDKTEVAKANSAQDTVTDNIDIDDISKRRRNLEADEEFGNGAVYQDEKNQFNIVNIILLVILPLLLIRFSYMYLSWLIAEVTLGHSKGRKFALDYIKNIVWYLKRADFTMSQEETLREFLKRVQYDYNERFFNIPQVTVILEKIRYSNQDITAEERRTLEEFRKKVKKLALEKCGAIQFFISLYILGR